MEVLVKASVFAMLQVFAQPRILDSQLDNFLCDLRLNLFRNREITLLMLRS